MDLQALWGVPLPFPRTGKNKEHSGAALDADQLQKLWNQNHMDLS